MNETSAAVLDDRGDRKSSGLSVTDVTVRYNDIAAVRGASFSVRPGEVFGILGPSGAGKSSLLAALTGLTPSEGRVILNGQDVTGHRPRDRRFGNVYQDFRLFDWMSVRENIAFGCKALGLSASQTRDRVDWAVQRMGLSAYASRRASDLSGGQRQRVGIARALAFEPRALFLDEPFSDLDPPLRVRLRREVLRHIREFPVPVILVTHDRSEAFELCDRIGVMLDGSILQVDEPATLWKSPRTLAVAEFIGYSNRLTGHLKQSRGSRTTFITSIGECEARVVAEPMTRIAEVDLVCLPASVVATGGSEPQNNVFEFRLESVHQTETAYSLILVSTDGDVWTAHSATPPDMAVGKTIRYSVLPDALLAFPSPRSRE